MTKISKYEVIESATLKAAMAVMNDGRFGIVLVVDDGGVLKGLLTDGDVRRALLDGASLEAVVSEYMNRDYTYGLDTDDHEVNIKLLNERVRHLPVLGEGGRPVDLISWAEMWRLPVAQPFLGGNELAYVSDCISTNWISSQGYYVKHFEDMFREYFSLSGAVSTSSGTTALHLALAALGIGPGDEVIVPDLTFAACANVVLQCGATPVLVDILEDSWTIDPSKIESSVTDRTRAIMAVHLYGHPCDMDPLMEVAERHGLYVIEDCAESLGSEYKGRLTGTIGDVGCFSFFANKVITTGEGGMVITDNDDLEDKMHVLRDHGMTKGKRYWHDVAGFNYRMTNIQAAIGVAQMEKVGDFIEKRRRTAKIYSENLVGIPGLTIPAEAEWAKSIFWLYSILIDEGMTGISAEGLMESLSKNGVDTRPLFYPLNIQPPYDGMGRAFPVSEKVAREGVSLPTSYSYDQEDIERVCRAIKDILLSSGTINKELEN